MNGIDRQSSIDYLELTSIGTLPNPLLALTDAHGVRSLEGYSYTEPLAIFSQKPALPSEYLDEAHDDPIPFVPGSMLINSKLALHNPRTTWFITRLKNRKSTQDVVSHGNSNFEVSQHYGSKSMPKFLIRCTNDSFIVCKISDCADEAMEQAGIDSKLLLGEDVVHMLDFGLDVEDFTFVKYLLLALDFAINEV